MRVLHVLGELRPSGAEVMLQVSGRHWASAGVDSYVLSTGGEQGPYAPQLQQAGYRLLHLPFTKSPSFLFRYYSLLRCYRFEVVHIHTERANFYLGMLARLAGARVVRTIHSVFQFRGALRAKRIVQRGVLRASRVRHVMVGPSVTENERSRFANKGLQISNWYDTNRFRPASRKDRALARLALGLKDDEFVVVTVGNCSPVKNHILLLEALVELKPSEKLLYLHVGQEEAGCPERQKARELGLEERVRFLGPMADVLKVLHGADVFVMPSRYEGSSLAAIEALAAGVPVVLTDVPGLSDLKILCGQPFWADPERSSLARAISRVRELRLVERSQLTQAASERVRELFRPETAVRQLLRLYGLSRY